MDNELKQYLKNYLGDLRYWRDLEMDSVNHNTSGTPHMCNEQQLATYTSRLAKLLKKEQDNEWRVLEPQQERYTGETKVLHP